MKTMRYVLVLTVGMATHLSAQRPSPIYVVDGVPIGQEPVCVIDGANRPASDCSMRKQDPGDPFARYLFPPDLVISHQQAINLTDKQRAAIQQAMKDAQGSFIDAQFKLSGEVEKLQHLLQGTTVDETKTLEQIDRVLAGERDIKHAQVTLMIRVKNQLSEQQQATLRQLRDKGPR